MRGIPVSGRFKPARSWPLSVEEQAGQLGDTVAIFKLGSMAFTGMQREPAPDSGQHGHRPGARPDAVLSGDMPFGALNPLVANGAEWQES